MKYKNQNYWDVSKVRFPTLKNKKKNQATFCIFQIAANCNLLQGFDYDAYYPQEHFVRFMRFIKTFLFSAWFISLLLY